MALETNVDAYDLWFEGYLPTDPNTSYAVEVSYIEREAAEDAAAALADAIQADREWAEWEMIRDMDDYYDGTGY